MACTHPRVALESDVVSPVMHGVCIECGASMVIYQRDNDDPSATYIWDDEDDSAIAHRIES